MQKPNCKENIFSVPDVYLICAYISGSGIIPGYKQAFSSYPGSLLSGDDFYMISSGMVINNKKRK